MPGRDPEAAMRSARVAREIRAEMRRKGMSGVQLRDAIERLRGMPVPNQMWMSRRITGEVNLVQPERVVYGPTDDLRVIAQALGIDPARLVRVVNSPKKAPKHSKTADDQTESTTPAGDDQTPATDTAE